MAISKTTAWRYRQMSVADRQELAAFLLQTIQEDQEKGKESPVEKPLKVMEMILGHPVPNDRSREGTWARTIIAMYLLKQGYSLSATGRMLDRDHSVISYYRKTWREALEYPKMYQKEIALNDLFISML